MKSFENEKKKKKELSVLLHAEFFVVRLQGSNKEREREDAYVVQYAGVAISVTKQEEKDKAKKAKKAGRAIDG